MNCVRIAHYLYALLFPLLVSLPFAYLSSARSSDAPFAAPCSSSAAPPSSQAETGTAQSPPRPLPLGSASSLRLRCSSPCSRASCPSAAPSASSPPVWERRRTASATAGPSPARPSTRRRVATLTSRRSACAIRARCPSSFVPPLTTGTSCRPARSRASAARLPASGKRAGWSYTCVLFLASDFADAVFYRVVYL